MKYVIKDRLVCYVTWTYEVEAETEEDASALFQDGACDPSESEPEIGDCLDWCPQTTTITPVEE